MRQSTILHMKLIEDLTFDDSAAKKGSDAHALYVDILNFQTVANQSIQITNKILAVGAFEEQYSYQDLLDKKDKLAQEEIKLEQAKNKTPDDKSHLQKIKKDLSQLRFQLSTQGRLVDAEKARNLFALRFMNESAASALEDNFYHSIVDANDQASDTKKLAAYLCLATQYSKKPQNTSKIEAYKKKISELSESKLTEDELKLSPDAQKNALEEKEKEKSRKLIEAQFKLFSNEKITDEQDKIKLVIRGLLRLHKARFPDAELKDFVDKLLLEIKKVKEYFTFDFFSPDRVAELTAQPKETDAPIQQSTLELWARSLSETVSDNAPKHQEVIASWKFLQETPVADMQKKAVEQGKVLAPEIGIILKEHAENFTGNEPFIPYSLYTTESLAKAAESLAALRSSCKEALKSLETGKSAVKKNEKPEIEAAIKNIEKLLTHVSKREKEISRVMAAHLSSAFSKSDFIQAPQVQVELWRNAFKKLDKKLLQNLSAVFDGISKKLPVAPLVLTSAKDELKDYVEELFKKDKAEILQKLKIIAECFGLKKIVTVIATEPLPTMHLFNLESDHVFEKLNDLDTKNGFIKKLVESLQEKLNHLVRENNEVKYDSVSCVIHTDPASSLASQLTEKGVSPLDDKGWVPKQKSEKKSLLQQLKTGTETQTALRIFVRHMSHGDLSKLDSKKLNDQLKNLPIKLEFKTGTKTNLFISTELTKEQKDKELHLEATFDGLPGYFNTGYWHYKRHMFLKEFGEKAIVANVALQNLKNLSALLKVSDASKKPTLKEWLEHKELSGILASCEKVNQEISVLSKVCKDHMPDGYIFGGSGRKTKAIVKSYESSLNTAKNAAKAHQKIVADNLAGQLIAEFDRVTDGVTAATKDEVMVYKLSISSEEFKKLRATIRELDPVDPKNGQVKVKRADEEINFPSFFWTQLNLHSSKYRKEESAYFTLTENFDNLRKFCTDYASNDQKESIEFISKLINDEIKADSFSTKKEADSYQKWLKNTNNKKTADDFFTGDNKKENAFYKLAKAAELFSRYNATTTTLSPQEWVEDKLVDEWLLKLSSDPKVISYCKEGRPDFKSNVVDINAQTNKADVVDYLKKLVNGTAVDGGAQVFSNAPDPKKAKDYLTWLLRWDFDGQMFAEVLETLKKSYEAYKPETHTLHAALIKKIIHFASIFEEQNKSVITKKATIPTKRGITPQLAKVIISSYVTKRVNYVIAELKKPEKVSQPEINKDELDLCKEARIKDPIVFNVTFISLFASNNLDFDRLAFLGDFVAAVGDVDQNFEYFKKLSISFLAKDNNLALLNSTIEKLLESNLSDKDKATLKIKISDFLLSQLTDRTTLDKNKNHYYDLIILYGTTESKAAAFIDKISKVANILFDNIEVDYYEMTKDMDSDKTELFSEIFRRDYISQKFDSEVEVLAKNPVFLSVVNKYGDDFQRGHLLALQTLSVLTKSATRFSGDDEDMKTAEKYFLDQHFNLVHEVGNNHATDEAFFNESYWDWFSYYLANTNKELFNFGFDYVAEYGNTKAKATLLYSFAHKKIKAMKDASKESLESIVANIKNITARLVMTCIDLEEQGEIYKALHSSIKSLMEDPEQNKAYLYAFCDQAGSTLTGLTDEELLSLRQSALNYSLSAEDDGSQLNFLLKYIEESDSTKDNPNPFGLDSKDGKKILPGITASTAVPKKQRFSTWAGERPGLLARIKVDLNKGLVDLRVSWIQEIALYPEKFNSNDFKRSPHLENLLFLNREFADRESHTKGSLENTLANNDPTAFNDIKGAINTFFTSNHYLLPNDSYPADTFFRMYKKLFPDMFIKPYQSIYDLVQALYLDKKLFNEASPTADAKKKADAEIVRATSAKFTVLKASFNNSQDKTDYLKAYTILLSRFEIICREVVAEVGDKRVVPENIITFMTMLLNNLGNNMPDFSAHKILFNQVENLKLFIKASGFIVDPTHTLDGGNKTLVARDIFYANLNSLKTYGDALLTKRDFGVNAVEARLLAMGLSSDDKKALCDKIKSIVKNTVENLEAGFDNADYALPTVYQSPLIYALRAIDEVLSAPNPEQFQLAFDKNIKVIDRYYQFVYLLNAEVEKETPGIAAIKEIIKNISADKEFSVEIASPEQKQFWVSFYDAMRLKGLIEQIDALDFITKTGSSEKLGIAMTVSSNISKLFETRLLSVRVDEIDGFLETNQALIDSLRDVASRAAAKSEVNVFLGAQLSKKLSEITKDNIGQYLDTFPVLVRLYNAVENKAALTENINALKKLANKILSDTLKSAGTFLSDPTKHKEITDRVMAAIAALKAFGGNDAAAEIKAQLQAFTGKTYPRSMRSVAYGDVSSARLNRVLIEKLLIEAKLPEEVSAPFLREDVPEAAAGEVATVATLPDYFRDETNSPKALRDVAATLCNMAYGDKLTTGDLYFGGDVAYPSSSHKINVITNDVNTAVDLNALPSGYYMRFIPVAPNGFHLYGIEIAADRKILIHENRAMSDNHLDKNFIDQLMAQGAQLIVRTATAPKDGIKVHGELARQYATTGSVGIGYKAPSGNFPVAGRTAQAMVSGSLAKHCQVQWAKMSMDVLSLIQAGAPGISVPESNDYKCKTVIQCIIDNTKEENIFLMKQNYIAMLIKSGLFDIAKFEFDALKAWAAQDKLNFTPEIFSAAINAVADYDGEKTPIIIEVGNDSHKDFFAKLSRIDSGVATAITVLQAHSKEIADNGAKLELKREALKAMESSLDLIFDYPEFVKAGESQGKFSIDPRTMDEEKTAALKKQFSGNYKDTLPKYKAAFELVNLLKIFVPTGTTFEEVKKEFCKKIVILLSNKLEEKDVEGKEVITGTKFKGRVSAAMDNLGKAVGLALLKIKEEFANEVKAVQKPVDPVAEEKTRAIAAARAQQMSDLIKRRESEAKEKRSQLSKFSLIPTASENKEESDPIVNAAQTKADEALNLDCQAGKPDLDDETKTFLVKQYYVAELIMAGKFDLAQSEFKLLWKQRFSEENKKTRKLAFRLNIFLDAIVYLANYNASSDSIEQAVLRDAKKESYTIFFGRLASLHDNLKASVDDMLSKSHELGVNEESSSAVEVATVDPAVKALEENVSKILDVVWRDLSGEYHGMKNVLLDSFGKLPPLSPEQAKTYVKNLENAPKYNALADFHNVIIPKAKGAIKAAYEDAGGKNCDKKDSTAIKATLTRAVQAAFIEVSTELKKMNPTEKNDTFGKLVGLAKNKIDVAAKKTYDLPKAGAAASLPRTIPASQNPSGFLHPSAAPSRGLDFDVKKPTTLATSARYGGAFTKK